MSEFKAHVFVCTNSPDKEGRCGHKNAEKLRRDIKDLCKKENWSTDVRINSAGCLGHCERGIAAVIYPQNQWFFDLQESDSEKVFIAVASALNELAEKHK